ncbi:MAG: hypothetical protein ACLFNO_03780 [Parcubacteria group bacterium]
MSKFKYIYWRPDMGKNEKGEMYANVHILVDGVQGTLLDFQKIADEIRKTFPEATYSTICAGTVFKSKSVKGFKIVTWDAYIPKRNYLGWRQFQTGNIKYDW